MRKVVIFTIAAMSFCWNTSAKPVLPAVFSDNMVLQQQTQVPIWGQADKGKTVKVIPSWDEKTYTVSTDAQGNWKLEIPTPKAGGPYEISISDGKSIKLSNVMIGEVWICSGQSNMEMPLKGWGKVQNFQQEIDNANYPNIRLYQVKKTISPIPLTTGESTMGGWQNCSPQTVEEFSAVAYFFARELTQKLNVPVGVIDVTWGGTPAESWTSVEALQRMSDFAPQVSMIQKAQEDMPGAMAIYNRQIDEWEAQVRSKDAGYDGKQPLWADIAYDDASWGTIQLPGLLEEQVDPAFEGFIWLRREIDLSDEWLKRDLKIELNYIDDDDITFFNGEEIGRTYGVATARHYTVPRNLLRKGKNVLTIRLGDTGGNSGVLGDPAMLYATNGKKKISLAGEWKQHISIFNKNEVPQQPQSFQASQIYSTVLYNGMLHPLIPFEMKGVIWYQGEANSDRAYQYRDLFPLMIRDWRNQWNKNFPFYYVQLASFMARADKPEESAWAELREAQTRTLELEDTGMAVTIDIGDANDIHPKNKQEVGRRLSLIALNQAYGKTNSYSGPLYSHMCMKNNEIELSFNYTEGQLIAKGGALKGFTIAGVDHKFYPATARIVDNKVIVSSEQVPYPVAVRYAWANNPECNLYNKAGLPASPFRTDDWRR
ncbi:sialate O-acetylesterase [Bacteroides sp.]